MAEPIDPATTGTEVEAVTGDSAPTQAASSLSKIYFINQGDKEGQLVKVVVGDPVNGYSSLETFVAQFTIYDAVNNLFLIGPGGDLFCLQVKNVAREPVNGPLVELYRMMAYGGYQILENLTNTAFDAGIYGDGTFRVDGGDIYWIRTKSTGTGKIEVHRAGSIDFRGFNMHQPASLPELESGNGAWDIHAGDLYFIKYRNTKDAHIEVHRLDLKSLYQNETVYQSTFDVRDGDNGTWAIGANADLYFIKTKNPDAGTVEVHIATAESGYTNVLHYPTGFKESDVPLGNFCVY
ncbi:hypothetical protein TWF694_008220 [Orbilia ellipsospora]|uniref:Uncharacterized protein n=1 Tax=Orbilia ellipsospora TaxID=2528407 RepID=A0AAV9XFF6_9PEZI